MSNSVDPDETAHFEPSHLDLRCLQKLIIVCGSERVRYLDISAIYPTCPNLSKSIFTTNKCVKLLNSTM